MQMRMSLGRRNNRVGVLVEIRSERTHKECWGHKWVPITNDQTPKSLSMELQVAAAQIAEYLQRQFGDTLSDTQAAKEAIVCWKDLREKVSGMKAEVPHGTA